MNNIPKISILMAVKNESLYIEQAINSIVDGQDKNLYELIIVDDNSTDDTYLKAKSYELKYCQIELFRSPGKGKVEAYNYAYKQCKANLIAFFAGVDIMPVGSLKKRCDYLADIDITNCFISSSKIQVLSKSIFENNLIIPNAQNKGNDSGQCLIFSNAIAKKIFPIPVCLPNEDTWILAFKMFWPHTSNYNDNVVSCIWRKHQGNTYLRNANFLLYKQSLINRYSAFYIFNNIYGKFLSNNSKKHLENTLIAIKFFEDSKLLSLFYIDLDLRFKLNLIFNMNLLFFTIKNYIKVLILIRHKVFLFFIKDYF